MYLGSHATFRFAATAVLCFVTVGLPAVYGQTTYVWNTAASGAWDTGGQLDSRLDQPTAQATLPTLVHSTRVDTSMSVSLRIEPLVTSW